MAKITLSVDFSTDAVTRIFNKPLPGSAPFVLALLCFSLVFTEFRCNDKPLMEIRGYQLVLGDSVVTTNPFEKALNDLDEKLGEQTTLKPVSQRIPPQPWAIAAVALLALSGVVLWLKHPQARLAAGISGLAAAASLFVLRYQMQHQVAEEHGDMLRVTFTAGFYLAACLTMAGAALALLGFFSPPADKNHLPAAEPIPDSGV